MELYDSGSTADLNRLAGACMALLQKNRLTVTTAESCTDRVLSAKLVDIPGISEVFQGSYITYSNKTKHHLLNISKTTLKEYGAVSTQTTREIVIGAIFVASADAVILITDITGPGGGGDEKSVGLMPINCYTSGRMIMEEHYFQGDRAAVRAQTVQSTLRLLRATILENIRA